MTSRLTKRELAVWKGIIKSGKTEGFVTDELAGFMEFTQTTRPTAEQKRKHVLSVMPTICLKANAENVRFRRTSPLGRGYDGEWGFASKQDLRAGAKWLKEHEGGK
jgi:hypothetical protein